MKAALRDSDIRALSTPIDSYYIYIVYLQQRTIGHGQNSRSRVLEGEVLVGELGPVDGLSSGPVVVREVTALAHETGNHAVERRALEAKILFSGAEGAKVFRRLGDNIGAKLHDDASGGLSTDGDIKVNLRLGPARMETILGVM